MSSVKKTRVIAVTDGDEKAREVLEMLAPKMGLRCISCSAGNPTPLTGFELIELIKAAESDPVLVMFDDKGFSDMGSGELALLSVAESESVEIIGAIAVASNTDDFDGAAVDFCIDRNGRKVFSPVDKKGRAVKINCCEEKNNKNNGEKNNFKLKPVIKGDTVDVLNQLDIPLIVGIGDIGKMEYGDDIFCGAPVTRRAIEEILLSNNV
jgi:stage V sporulation protein AE